MINVFVVIHFLLFISTFEASKNCLAHRNRFNLTELRKFPQVIREWVKILPFLLGDESEAIANSKMYTNIRHKEFNYLGPIGPSCVSKWNSYGKGDEEKRFCGDLSPSDKSKDCVVYSVGSNNEYQFEEDVFNRTSCRIEIIDCTMKSFTPPNYILPRIRTHNVCLGEKTEIIDGKQFVNWTTLNELTGLKASPDFLKMDIEGYEFGVLRSIVDSGENFPLQIAMEIHIGGGINGKFRPVYPAELIAFMDYLRRLGGYYLVNRRDGCHHCTEIVLAKLQCGDKKSYPNHMVPLKQFTSNHPLLQESVHKFINKNWPMKLNDK